MAVKSYKVLDVRERESTYSYTEYHQNYTAKHIVFTIIAEDKDGNRRRFCMCDNYKSKDFGEWCYYGYEGDFDLIVKGDWIEIEQTDTWPKVTILGVSDNE